jgi:hypothetical protein
MPNMSADDQPNTRKRRDDDSVASVADLSERRLADGVPAECATRWL